MKRGIVKSLNENGNGCIETIMGKQYKFHINTIEPNERHKIHVDGTVEFEVFTVLGHPVPLHIRVVNGA